MPNLDIYWKGYPHHRLPRIRVISTRRNSVPTRSLSTSGHSSRTLAQFSNKKENKKRPFQIQFRRRRVRSSRAPSSVVRARRRASVRARHNIQVFGWDTPDAELASKVTTELAGSKDLSPYRESTSRPNLRPTQDDSVIPSTDGTASSVPRGPKPPKKTATNAYSLRHVARVPVYWTAAHQQTQEKPSFNSDRLYSAPRTGPLQTTSNRTPNHRPTEGERTYGTVVDPLHTDISRPRRRSSRPRYKPHRFRRTSSQISPTRKDSGLSSPQVWEAARQSAFARRSGASITSAVQSLLSEDASRSPSQKRILARFTKGIELYLQAAKEHPSRSLISSLTSPSSTNLSARTIQELRPYRSEFQSAGLAVTSAEQKGMAKLQKGLTPPSTPPKDKKYEQNRSSPMKKSNDASKSAQKTKDLSNASVSTGSTVLGWTPPHERTYARPAKVERRRSSNSTDHTIIGFTPPHEMYASPPKPAREAPAPPRASTKKSLPWLRKTQASPEPSPRENLSVVSVRPQEHRPSTPLVGWVATFDVVEPVEKETEGQAAESCECA